MKFFLAISFFIVLVSCKTVTFHPDRTNRDYISFGNGGGFTGAVTQFYLTTDGIIYQETNSEYIRIKKIDRNTTKQCFDNFLALGLQNIELNSPGNRYYFIKYNKDGAIKELVWGGEASNTDKANLMYQMLNNLVKISDK